MGFFKNMLRRANGMPTDSDVSRALNNLRERVHALQGMALALDAENDSSDDLSLFFFLRMDLLSFSLHIAQSDNILEQKEVDAINVFLGMDMSYADCKTLIEDLGIGDKDFNASVPASFKILTEMAKGSSVGARKFADALITTYEQLGIVIASIDGDFDARERSDLNDYISMLKRYATRF